MTWHGIWASVKRNGSYESQFFHHLSDDKKEDGFAILSNLVLALLKMKQNFPDLQEAILITDGAGAYSGGFLAINLSMVGLWTGIQVKEHFISESGQGKVNT
jgi:hypothetical protein